MFYSKKLSLFKNIKHGFFSRNNGFSKGVYSSLNCGKGSYDNAQDVSKNLNYVANKMGVKINNLILMNQTHSNKVEIIDSDNLNNNKITADALITQLKNVAISVLTADCVPVILFNPKTKTIGCIHAGWRGALSGIVENTVNKFKKLGEPKDIIASIGPCIGVNNYEVGKEFYDKFVILSETNKKFFKAKNDLKFLFDIRKFVQTKIEECGVLEIDNIKIDTFADKSNFFSFRRSTKLGEPDYGRCISSIRLIEN